MSDPATTSKSIGTAQASSIQRAPWRAIVLVVGDALSFLVFVSVGRTSHGEVSGFGALIYVIGTALPFMAAWYAVAPFLGAFRRETTSSVLSMVTYTERAWLCAWPVAMLVRFVADRVQGVELNSGFLTFAAVVLVTNAIFLSVWRGAFAAITARRG